MIDERKMVDDRHDDQIKTAQNLPGMANSDESLQGYAAMNGLDEQSEIARRAYEMYQERGDEHGSADDDWFRAEQEVRRRREASNL